MISVEVQVAPNAPFGDYTIRLQSNSGETAFVPGAITIDPRATAIANPVDDSRFFINQHSPIWPDAPATHRRSINSPAQLAVWLARRLFRAARL